MKLRLKKIGVWIACVALGAIMVIWAFGPDALGIVYIISGCAAGAVAAILNSHLE